MSGTTGINPLIALNANAPKPVDPIAQVGQFAQAANGMMALRNGQVTPLQAAAALGGGGGLQGGLQAIGQMQMLQNGMRLPADYASPYQGQSESPWADSNSPWAGT